MTVTRRPRAAAPDPAQPALERRQVHGVRRGHRARGELGRRTMLHFSVSDTGIGHRRSAGLGAVRGLRAGRPVDDPAVRRDRSRAGDLAPAGRADGRRDRRRACARAAAACSGSRRRCRRWPSAARSPRGRSDLAGAADARRRRQRDQPDDSRALPARLGGRPAKASIGRAPRSRRSSAPRATARPSSCALLDFNMPQMDGVKLVREIRRRPALRALKTVILSSGRSSTGSLHGLEGLGGAKAGPPGGDLQRDRGRVRGHLAATALQRRRRTAAVEPSRPDGAAWPRTTRSTRWSR